MTCKDLSLKEEHSQDFTVFPGNESTGLLKAKTSPLTGLANCKPALTRHEELMDPAILNHLSKLDVTFATGCKLPLVCSLLLPPLWNEVSWRTARPLARFSSSSCWPLRKLEKDSSCELHVAAQEF